MPNPVNGVTGVAGERSPASADIVAEVRQRQADRLRAAQAEGIKPTEVVEAAEKGDTTATTARRESIHPYRVNLDPDTGRLSTEVLDTATGDVIMRIPPQYIDPAEALEDGEPVHAGHRREPRELKA
ncbi:hypothetical protein [Azospirillum thermophilum]|uniref:hypothetical protein n=1 Tax=Azospirillum thermophilum TaxID=2202148 RepID=UPI0015E8BDFB|nr:hypothetical protein [Azospirillum thermophilum]